MPPAVIYLPEPIPQGPETVRLSDGFFAGPLTGGVGVGIGDGAVGGGGRLVVIAGGTAGSFSVAAVPPGGFIYGRNSGGGGCGGGRGGQHCR
jgi:hypothetical protein